MLRHLACTVQTRQDAIPRIGVIPVNTLTTLRGPTPLISLTSEHTPNWIASRQEIIKSLNGCTRKYINAFTTLEPVNTYLSEVAPGYTSDKCPKHYDSETLTLAGTLSAHLLIHSAAPCVGFPNIPRPMELPPTYRNFTLPHLLNLRVSDPKNLDVLNELNYRARRGIASREFLVSPRSFILTMDVLFERFTQFDVVKQYVDEYIRDWKLDRTSEFKEVECELRQVLCADILATASHLFPGEIGINREDANIPFRSLLEENFRDYSNPEISEAIQHRLARAMAKKADENPRHLWVGFFRVHDTPCRSIALLDSLNLIDELTFYMAEGVIVEEVNRAVMTNITFLAFIHCNFTKLVVPYNFVNLLKYHVMWNSIPRIEAPRDGDPIMKSVVEVELTCSRLQFDYADENEANLRKLFPNAEKIFGLNRID